jgi:hypothetical protein
LAEALARLADGRREAVDEAVRLFQAVAEAGGSEAGEAHERLALLRAAGVGVPQSWEAALDHLARGAAQGSGRAAGQLQVLAGGVKTDNWRDLQDRGRLADWLLVGEKRVLSPSPRAVAMDGFLSPATCAWLIGIARGRTVRALTYARGGSNFVPSVDRTNTAFDMAFNDLDTVVILVRARIAAAIGLPSAAFESTQILHYGPGETYRPHFDFLDPALPEVAERGQRIVTFLIYLNDDFAGGETDFPRLGLNHRGAAGGALYFANLDGDGLPDRRTLHAGLPPSGGEKWLLSQWVRNIAWV